MGTISNTSQADNFSNEHMISRGIFYNLYLGDYITIQDGTYNKQWMIAGFDSKMGNGNTSHHIILTPKKNLTTAKMNSTDTTTGGYYSTEMNTTTLPNIANTLSNVLGSHMATHKVYMSNTVSNISPYKATAGAYYDTKLALMSEMDVFGTNTYSNQYDDGGQTSKLPVFNHITPIQYEAVTYWLRGANSTYGFMVVRTNGTVGTNGAHFSSGVRPCLMLI